MIETKYIMAYATGGLLYRQSLIVTEQFDQLQDWGAVKALVLRHNLLQMRTVSSTKRMYQEVSLRLMKLTKTEMDMLLNSSRQEQSYLLWLAVCKRYRFVREFATEVLREKYLRYDFDLTYDDFDIFFNNKAEWHPEVEAIADSTRKKQRQYLFKMMREADLLSQDDRIIPVLLTPQLVEVISQDSPALFTIFPITEADMGV